MGKKFDFEFTPFTFEQLREMNHQELHQNLLRFRRMIKEATAAGKDTQPFEKEYCYLDNEIQFRAKHKRR